MKETQMSFDELIAKLNEKLMEDSKKICGSINEYKNDPKSNPFEIKLEAFDKVVPFNNHPTDDTVIKKAKRGKAGIYIFLMTSAWERSKDFNYVDFGAKLNDTKITIFNPGDILYVGKAKSFQTRMNQHFTAANKDNRTGSLKLLSPQRKDLIGHFTVYAFCIKTKYKKYYEIIAPTVESAIRERLKPIVGN